MPTYIGIDQSKQCTGWALWNDEWPTLRHGYFSVGSEYATEGQTYMAMHKKLNDIYKVEPFDHCYFEEPINPAHLTGNTSVQTIWMLAALAAHIQSFAAAKRCRIVRAVNVERWRKDFIGSMVVNEVRAGVRRARKGGDKKASATTDLKKLTVQRAFQLGFNVRKNDEADAIGILTYSLLLNGITPPWMAEEALRPLLPLTTSS